VPGENRRHQDVLCPNALYAPWAKIVTELKTARWRLDALPIRSCRAQSSILTQGTPLLEEARHPKANFIDRTGSTRLTDFPNRSADCPIGATLYGKNPVIAILTMWFVRSTKELESRNQENRDGDRQRIDLDRIGRKKNLHDLSATCHKSRCAGVGPGERAGGFQSLARSMRPWSGTCYSSGEIRRP